MIEVNQLCGQLYLGKQGENLARIVYFEEPDTWKKDFGEGKCELLHQRNGDSAPYPVKLETENGKVCWKITASDTAIVGDGKCELHYLVDDVVVKSKIWKTTVLESLGGEVAEAPEPEKAWVDEVLEAAQKVEDGTVHPPVIGDNKNWWVWDFASSAYVDTGICAEGEPGKDGKDGEPGSLNLIDGQGEGSVRLKDAEEVTERHGVALGYLCYAHKASFVTGYENRSLGYGGAVFGTRNIGDGWGVVVGGQDNNVNGAVNAVFGSANNVQKPLNFVSGAHNFINGEYNNVIGSTNEASGNYNILSGKNVKAYTNNNIMFGNGVNGIKSGGNGGVVAIGNTIYAQFDDAVVLGNGLVAGAKGQIVLGKWNNPNNKALVIGCGEEGARKNALEVDKDGNAKFSGTITDGSGNVLGGSSPLDWYDVTLTPADWKNTTGTYSDGSIGVYDYAEITLTVKNAVGDYYPTAIFPIIRGQYNNPIDDLRNINASILSIKDKTVTLYFSTPLGSSLMNVVRTYDIPVKIGLVKA